MSDTPRTKAATQFHPSNHPGGLEYVDPDDMCSLEVAFNTQSAEIERLKAKLADADSIIANGEVGLPLYRRTRDELYELRDDLSAARAALEDFPAVLKSLLDHTTRNECQHEETHRGGAIWTICDSCGRKWADDRGGFVPYEEPEAITNGYALLEKLQALAQSGRAEAKPETPAA